MKSKKRYILIALIALLLIIISYNYIKDEPVKIGYFHGGRTIVLFRTYFNDYFAEEDIKVNLITKNLNNENYFIVSKHEDYKENIKNYGRATGNELIEKVMGGEFNGATIGGSSFIMAAEKGLPIVAVAELSHDTERKPAHAIIFHKNITINNSSDIKGKTLASKRSGGGDRMFLREFLLDEGLDPEKDVTIIDDLSEDELVNYINNGYIDGGYFHLHSLRKVVKRGKAYIYRKLDWINPEISQGLLIFRKDFVENNPDKVQKIINAYMKRIEFEKNISKEEKKELPKKKDIGIKTTFQGLSSPQTHFPPFINSKSLNQLQELLLKHKIIEKRTKLEDFIDNSFVEKAYNELNE